jgi:hypothetical protein
MCLAQDEEEDQLKARALTRLIDRLKKDPERSSQYVDLILLSRNMERIGDHATNVAEDVIFMVQGKDIRHHLSDPHQINHGARASPVHQEFSCQRKKWPWAGRRPFDPSRFAPWRTSFAFQRSTRQIPVG